MPAPNSPPIQRRDTINPGSEVVPINVRNYQAVVDTLKANNGAEARALKSMFAGNKQLVDRFLSVCFSLLAADSDLLRKATPMSIVEAIKKAASLGLEPMTEDAAIVAYGDKATLLPQYRGYLKRMRRSGLVKQVGAKMVYENDEFDHWEDEEGFHFRHHPTRTERGDYWGCYAYAVMNEGFVHGIVMTVADINYVRDTWGNKISRNGKPLPWDTSYDQMALKTAIRRLSKLMPQEAVGSEFLALERESDNAEDKVRILERQVRDDLADVRALALQAVGQLPPGTDTTGPDEGNGASNGSSSDTAESQSGNGERVPSTEPPEQAEASPAPSNPAEAGNPGPDQSASATVDPTVRAAMELAAEQERIKQYRRS